MTAAVAPVPRRVISIELLVVLLVSLGNSAIYAVLSLIEKLTRNVPLNQQTTSINNSAVPDRPWLDLAYQVSYIILPLAPVALCLYLLAVHLRPADGPFRSMGFDLSRPWRDLGWGSAIFAGIGVLGLAFYLVAVAAGINTQVSPANLTANWWTVPALILLAVKNGVLEEVLMIGYLFTRWEQTGRPMWTIVVVSALVRGGYHLYQGFGGFIGNFVMGLAFGWLFLTILKKRVMPLVVTHSLLDIAAFLGAPLLPWLMSLIGR
ncbi:MAG: CPBP family intramembrane metalloprotease [Arachnia sp.]